MIPGRRWSQKQRPERTNERDTITGVALIFASGFLLNQLSDLVRLSAPITVGLSAVLAVVMARRASENAGAGRLPRRSARRNGYERLAQLALSSVVLGSIIGGTCVLPVFATKTIDLNVGWNFHSYELAGFILITSVASIGFARSHDLGRTGAFITGAVAGMSLAVVFFKPHENSFSITFLGWSIAASVLVLVLVQLPLLARELRDFISGR